MVKRIGDITSFAQELQDRFAEAVKTSPSNDSFVLTVAANYGGQWDIVQVLANFLLQLIHQQHDPRVYVVKLHAVLVQRCTSRFFIAVGNFF